MKNYKVYKHAIAEQIEKDLNPDDPLESLILERKSKSVQIRLKPALWRSLRIRAGQERVSVTEIVNRYLMFYCFPESESLFQFRKKVPSRRLWHIARPGEPWPGVNNVSKNGDVQTEMDL